MTGERIERWNRDDRKCWQTIKKKQKNTWISPRKFLLGCDFFVWGLSFELQPSAVGQNESDGGELGGEGEKRNTVSAAARKRKHVWLNPSVQKKKKIKCNPWSRNDLNTFFPTCCYYCSDTEGSACRLEHLLHLDFYFLKARVRWWIFVCQKGGKKKEKKGKRLFFCLVPKIESYLYLRACVASR